MNQRWIRKMHISLSLLFLFMGSTSTKKQGDFGSLTACITKDDLRLDCFYGNCSGSPRFDCEFMTFDGFLPANESKKCRVILRDHPVLYANKTTSYTCILTRKGRKEEKEITIDYSKTKGKQRIRRCPSTVGLLLHQAPTLLWPVVVLSLWRVLDTDSQTT